MIEPPAHLSAGARSYLRDPDVLSYPTDWSDPWQVQEFREHTTPLWSAMNDSLDFDYDVSDGQVAGVAVEKVSAGAPRGGVAILHFHGGMYCLGTPAIDRVLNAPIARATGIEVISPDYRLAPEYPFPAALNDALAVYRALAEQGLQVAIYGESAGGGLAAACTVAALGEGLPSPVAVALLSPMLDLTGGSDTYNTLAPVDPDYGDTSVLLEPGAAYAGDTALDHPFVSPLFADLTGFPPTLIQVGNREVLMGDSARFARAARSAGAVVHLEILDGGWHNYPIWFGLPEADAAIVQLADFLGGALT